MTVFGGIRLRQLVLIATAWRDWSIEEESWRGVDRLVRALLGPAADGPMDDGPVDDLPTDDRPTAKGPVDAWLAVTGDGAVRAEDWVSGAHAQQDVRKFVERLRKANRSKGVACEQAITGSRLRVLCGPTRTEAVFQAAGAGDRAAQGDQDRRARPRHWTALDVQFVSETASKFQMHLGFSFWAIRPPWHPEEVSDTAQTLDLDGIPALRATFERRAATAATNLVDKHFGPTTTLVWRREHAPPMFWAATVTKPRKDLAKYLDDADVAERLIRPLLDRGPLDSGVAASIINGNVFTLRHFRQEHVGREHVGRESAAATAGAVGVGAGSAGSAGGVDGTDQVAIRPVYFLLLGPPPADRDNVPQDYGPQQVITSLTEFEARAATDMHEIHDDIEVWGTHVRVYDSVAAQAGTLWDALALHLPVRKGNDLAATHRAIALVHQTLLQGVADLAEVESQVMALTTRVDELADALADLVNERLAERPLSTAYHGVGESVAQASQLTRLRRRGNVVLTDARRVKREYEDLLTSIGHAFDERRVRELDVLQRGGHSLSVAVAAVTTVAVLDFIFNVKSAHPMPDDARFVLRLFAWGFLLCLVAVIVSNWWSVRKAQRITSSDFRAGYDEVLSYLRDSSTKELNLHPAAGGRRPGDAERDDRADWAELDHKLATRFAARWDAATAGRPRDPSQDREPDEDIKLLAKDVEDWTQRALLLTERPRRLSRYRLPKLTLLYRHCVALERAKQWETVERVVADVDLELTLHEKEGYSVVEARAIDRHIRKLIEDTNIGSTTDLLAHIEAVLDSRTPGGALEDDNRKFVKFAVKWLTERGVRQFIDVGSGLPESDGVHDLAKTAKVLYVDHALDVITQGQGLLRESGRADFIDADMRLEPDKIFDKARALRFDFTQPLAVLFTRVLGEVSDADARATMATFRERLPAGAYVVISHAAPGDSGDGGPGYVPTNSNGGGLERLRSRRAIHGFFDHLHLDHGLVDAADPSGETTPRAGKTHIAAGIGHLP